MNNSITVDGQTVTAEDVRALMAHVERLRESFDDLIRNSEGVAGLHKNGDVAPWGDLLEGGHFEEWLLPLSETPPQSLQAIRAEAGAQGEVVPVVWISARDLSRTMIASKGERAEVAPDREPGFTEPLYRHPPAPAIPEALREKVLELIGAVKNEDDLPAIKYALRCGRLVNQVEDMLSAAPDNPAPNYKDLYSELLYAVERKHPSESRHETALRYIRNAESGGDNRAQAAPGKQEMGQ